MTPDEEAAFYRKCHGKRRHLTMDEAKRTAKEMHKLHKKKMDAYHCNFCGLFHVGSRRTPEHAIHRRERLAFNG